MLAKEHTINTKGSKAKKNILFFVGMIAAVILLMVVANLRSKLLLKLTPPEGGVRKLFTSGDSLVAVSSRNEVYVWDWKNLSSEPEKCSVTARDVTWMQPGQLVWAALPEADTIVVSDLKGEKEHKRIFLGQEWQCEILRTSRNGRFSVVGMINKTDDEGDANLFRKIRIGLLDSKFEKVDTIVTISDEGNDFELSNIAVSEDGATVAVVGSSNGGWIAAPKVKQKKVIWEKFLEHAIKIDEVTFAPDGKKLYAVGRDFTVHEYETETGEGIHSWITGRGEYKKVDFHVWHSVGIEASSDGYLIAVAGQDTGVEFFDTKDLAKKGSLAPAHHIPAGIAFSPDASMLATADIRADGIIKIWQVQKIY